MRFFFLSEMNFPISQEKMLVINSNKKVIESTYFVRVLIFIMSGSFYLLSCCIVGI